MSRMCEICGKKPVAGRSIVRTGLAKKKGGVGRRIIATNKRRFLPNLQKVRAIVNGKVKSIKACTRCIKAGKVKKAA